MNHKVPGFNISRDKIKETMRLYRDGRSRTFIADRLNISRITATKIINTFESDPEFASTALHEVMVMEILNYMAKTTCPKCENAFITLTSMAYPMCTSCFHQFPLHSGVKEPEVVKKFVFGD